MEKTFQQHEETITKSRERLYLPVLPETAHSPNYPVIFKHKKFVKSKTRLIYKHRAVSILDNAIKSHGNIQELMKENFKSSDIGRSSERFKRRYLSRCLANDVLLRRDRWVQCMYFTLNKLNGYCKTQFAKAQLSTDDDRIEAILGTACHSKGWTPYFPEFCFTGGIKEFPFDRSGKQRRPKVINPCLEGQAIYPCLGMCIPASEEQALKVLDILEKCQTLDRKQLRKFLMTLNKCSSVENTPYVQTVEKRNHPIGCYSGENLCPSDLVVLRKLNPHYANVRKLYQILNELKIIHEMISDLDAAVACGDFIYLRKLLAYMPPEKTSQVHAVERPTSIVNSKTMAEKYGKHLLNFYKAIDNLPRTPCICCERLTDNVHIKTITARRKNLGNVVWQQLLNYLNSSSRTITRGESRIDSLIGQTICSSCSSELNKNKIPTISIINGMDTGSQPDCIKALSEFESIFIHLAMCYQTIIKLTPMGANLPYSARMDKLKGFAVHITQPLNSAITELFGNRPTKLINPDEYIVLHGIPKKDRAVWQRLVSVEKIHAALVWLKKNNHLYHKIDIPENPIDLLPPDVAQKNDSDDECDAGKKCDSDSCNDTISNASSKSLTAFDVDDTLPHGPGTAPASESSNSSGNFDSDICDSINSLHASSDSKSEDSIDSTDSQGSASDGEQADINKSDINDRIRQLSGGGSKDEQNHNIDFKDEESKQEVDEDELDAEVLRQDDIERIENMSSQTEKLKFVIINKLLGYARQLPVLGHVCHDCCEKMKNTRINLTRRLGSQYAMFNHNSFDLANLTELVSKHKAAVEASSSTLPLIVCTFCKCMPNSKTLNSKRCKKIQKIMTNCENMKYDINELRTEQINYLTKLDNLRTDGYLCKSCFVKCDGYCKVKNLKLKSENKLVKTLRKSLSKVSDCNEKVTILTTVADQLKEADITNACAKCRKDLSPLNRALPSLSSRVTFDNACYSGSASKDCINELHISITDEDFSTYEYLGALEVHGSRAHSVNVERTLTFNRACINFLIRILKLTRKHNICCKACVGTVEDSLGVYKTFLEGKELSTLDKFESNYCLTFRLGYIDIEVFRSLSFDALNRFKNAVHDHKCFDCNADLSDLITSKQFLSISTISDSLQQEIINTLESYNSSTD